MGNKVKTSDEGRGLLSLQENLRRLMPTLSHKFKVKRLGIFGSYVRGQACRSSDVDILVEFSGGIDLLDFVAMERYLRDKTGAKIDLVSIKALRPEFKSTILTEVIYI